MVCFFGSFGGLFYIQQDKMNHIVYFILYILIYFFQKQDVVSIPMLRIITTGLLNTSFHTLAMDMSLNRGETRTFYTLTEALYYLILPIINIPAAPFQNYLAAPLIHLSRFDHSLFVYRYDSA